nr:PREDICTED: uncharacterized protein LOC103280066 [Anolis carolinensis]|eukprot:XP_008116039.2 PREDICTED: uncharacterized protein LOC103280066 [Anolis carolinensis]
MLTLFFPSPLWQDSKASTTQPSAPTRLFTESEYAALQMPRVSQPASAAFQARRETLHENMQELSMATVYSLLAALMECLSMACLCVAISLLKWVIVLQHYSQLPRVFVSNTFGVPYEMVVYAPPGSNKTITGKLYFFEDEEEDSVVPVMITLCIMGLFFGFMAFLMDFVKIKRFGRHQMSITCFLHILSGIFIISLITLCCWCLMKIKWRTTEEGWKIFHLSVVPGESFYIILMCLALIILSVVFSVRSMNSE